jgi:hypothetical protein
MTPLKGGRVSRSVALKRKRFFAISGRRHLKIRQSEPVTAAASGRRAAILSRNVSSIAVIDVQIAAP